MASSDVSRKSHGIQPEKEDEELSSDQQQQEIVSKITIGPCGNTNSKKFSSMIGSGSCGSGSGNSGLPPIPPGGKYDMPQYHNQRRSSSPLMQSVKLQAGSSRLKSPARQTHATTAQQESSASSAEPKTSSSKHVKKKMSRRYASSLPDRDRHLTSPFDLSILLANSENYAAAAAAAENYHIRRPVPQSSCHAHAANLSSTSFRSQQSSKSTQQTGRQHCKNKYFQGRASLERDLFTTKPPSPTTVGSSTSAFSNSNRHSSYHPSLADEAAMAAAVAYKYNQMFFSRPTSPLFFDSMGGTTGAGGICGCGGGGITDPGMSCCCGTNRTLPRVSASASGRSGCRCCHQFGGSGLGCANSGSGLIGGSLLGLDYEDRLLRLESDKESLHLQVSVLSDQIDAQTSKIHDLEKLLDDKRNVLETTEETLQRVSSLELLTRSSLETQKLELLTEISSLRLKQASLERENFELKDRFVGNGLAELNYGPGIGGQLGEGRVWDKPPLGPLSLIRSSSPSQNNLVDSTTGNFIGTRSRIGSQSSESGSPQKSRPKTPPASAYRRVEQSAFGTLPRRTPSSQLSTFNGVPSEVSTNKSTSLSSGNIHAIAHLQSGSGNVNVNGNGGSKLNPISYHLQLKPLQCSESFSSGRYQPVSRFGAYPSSSGGGVGLYFASDPNTGTRSTSAPNLAAIERDDWERRNNNMNSKKSPGSHKSRGILRILGRLKRSNSGGLDNDVSPEPGAPFARGGLRSTAMPKLGWAKEPPSMQKPDGPITSWDSTNVILWLNYLGLGMYSNEVKRWVKTGQQLLDASPHELEKELGIKNALHRKKLNLALYCLKHPGEEDNAGKLDYHWVIRWLDDVGLPQYKESFGEARVDGRVLSHLTADDLFFLKVTSLLHHSSIKRGIQLLRIHKFHPGCLCRRGGPTTSTSVMQNGDDDGLRGPKNVATWTNHRVMEWLKAIDLAEYAPNLRGSGVHGALIIFEPKFNAELLSTLLSIPGNKTLLRRHLSLQVNELVGRYVMQEKRVIELAPEFIPISPTMKVKQPKPTKVFRFKGKRLSNEAPEEFLCPLEWDTYPFHSDSSGIIPSMENFNDGTTNGGEKVSNI